MSLREGSPARDVELAAGPGQTELRWQIRGSSLLVLGQGLSIGIQFATQVIMVRYLSKSGFGAFAYALSAVAILQIVATIGLNRTATRSLALYRERGNDDRALGTIVFAIAATLGVGTALAVLVVAGRGLISGSLISDRTAVSVLVILVALAPIQAVDDLMNGLFAVFRRVRAIFFRTYVLAPTLKLVAVIVLVLAGAGVRSLAAGFVAAAVLGLAIYSAVLVQTLRRQGLLQRLRPRAFEIPAQELLALGLPLLIADFAFVLITSSDAVILGHFRGTTEVGAFKAVQPAARLNEIVFIAFLTLFTPLASRLYARRDSPQLSALYWQTASWIAVVSFPIFALTFSLAKPFTLLMFGSRYEGSAIYLAILAVGSYVQAALGPNGTAVMVYGRVSYIVGVSIAAVAINLGLNLTLIPRYGALGAAIGTSVTQVLHNCLKQLALWRVTGIPFFDRRYLRVYGTVATAAIGLGVVQRLLPDDALTVFAIAAATSLLVLWINRHLLEVGRMFPELLRLSLARRLFGS